MSSRTLHELLPENLLDETIADIPLSGIGIDSRKIKPGDLFIALPGTQTHGKLFIEEAIQNGATAVISDHETQPLSIKNISIKNKQIPHIQIPTLAQYLAEIAARFYHHPANAFKLIAVTGTNGKTSTCNILTQILHALGYKCAMIGTIGQGIWPDLTHISNLTTPDAITLQQLFASFRDQQVDYVVMEASSHGLQQKRLFQTKLEAAVFTNLSQDHLDYHVHMASYAASKMKLFMDNPLKKAVINYDDSFSDTLKTIIDDEKLYGFEYQNARQTHQNNKKIIRCTRIDCNLSHTTLHCQINQEKYRFKSTLLTENQGKNLLTAISTLYALDMPIKKIQTITPTLKGVPGRTMLITNSSQIYCMVDYAHTPDALRQTLSSLKNMISGKIFCIFGCGGERDTSKRAHMGQIAEQFADHIIITDDNPRSEDPKLIAKNILMGCQKQHPYISDRKQAMLHALSLAKPNDLILISGKGHETRQLYNGSTKAHSDIQCIQSCLDSKLLI